MTGFGNASAEREWGTLTLELSSVNHRYQEISVRLPRELISWEPWFHQKLRAHFRRGKVQARADIAWAASLMVAPVNKEALVNYYEKIVSIRDSLGAIRDISVEALVNLPGVLDLPGRLALGRDEDTERMLGELLAAASENWNVMRRAEGAHLKSEIDSHLARAEKNISSIEELWPDTRASAFETMMERVNKALEAASAAPLGDSRFAQEVVILADRWDISEEIARMKSHITKFREIGEGGESEGRKLDFLVQEMNREVNTINSKVTNSEIRWIAVEAKTSIERMREQIQNLE
jgi:uncharacterized protein (TIGR00255 family)